jgi:hypothetical protein
MKFKSSLVGLLALCLMFAVTSIAAPFNKGGPATHRNSKSTIIEKVTTASASLNADYPLALAPDVIAFTRPVTSSTGLIADPVRKTKYWPVISASSNSPPRL